MVESKPKDSSEAPEGRPELALLKSKDAHEVVNPSSEDRAKAEADRTNASSGSAGELALSGKGLSREQIAARMAEQDDSISIDYGGGKTVSRLNPGTEKDLVAVGAKAWDSKTILAQNVAPGSVVTDATNATASPESALLYETDKSKIFTKPVETTDSGVQVTGLDYNSEGKPSNKLLHFVQSATARAMSPEARQAVIQGFIDKTIGVGEGLNLAKEEVKTTAMQASATAWKALNDGSVANFMAQPHAINEPLFKTIGSCLDAMKRDPHAVNNVLMVMGRELEAASKQYSQMSDRERGIQDGKAMFWFINPSGSTEAGDLALKIADNAATHIDAAVVKTVNQAMKAAQELAESSTEAAQQTKQMLLDYLSSKGLTGPQMQYAGIPKDYFYGMKPSEPLKASDTLNAMSKADDLGAGGSRINRGVDAAGNALIFTKESGIELAEMRMGQDKVWEQAPFPRGNDIHVVLGENLPAGTKTIDRVVFRDGIVESQKSIDLKSDTYQDMQALESRLRSCFHDLEIYRGQVRKRSSFLMKEQQISEKLLHFGLQDGVMTTQQKAVFEKVGREISEYNQLRPVGKAPVRFKVTVVR